MQGSIRKRGATWSYQFYIGMVDGKKRYKTKGGFQTKGEASAALRTALTDYEEKGYIEPSKLTLNEFADEWLENYIKPVRKISTYNRYVGLYNKYIRDTIGDIPLAEIKAYHIDKVLITNYNQVSTSTLQSVYGTINTIYNRALRLRVAKDNPCRYVDRPKREKVNYQVLDEKEIRQLYQTLDLSNKWDYQFYIAINITIELGLRRGELAGLEWQDINFENHTVIIKNNLIYTNGHTYIQTPKTEESKRTLFVSEQLLNLLKRYKLQQTENKLRYGEYYVKNIFDGREYDFVMRWENGHYIHPLYYTNKITKTIKKAGINKKIRFHDLRHTNATLLLKQGIDFKVIQNRLGHEDISTTINIYSHVDLQMQKEATNKLISALNFEKNSDRECQENVK